MKCAESSKRISIYLTLISQSHQFHPQTHITDKNRVSSVFHSKHQKFGFITGPRLNDRTSRHIKPPPNSHFTDSATPSPPYRDFFTFLQNPISPTPTRSQPLLPEGEGRITEGRTFHHNNHKATTSVKPQNPKNTQFLPFSTHTSPIHAQKARNLRF